MPLARSYFSYASGIRQRYKFSLLDENLRTLLEYPKGTGNVGRSLIDLHKIIKNNLNITRIS
ncbi:MAG: hypothetical protein CVV47_16750 [Spirochaetae bacterium HGW-Spirochaetae-3]|nr:MAG: hypothetical protein CVV47_16750 [Spirochaetae bacterium HGW-Spirochaetae-3]